MASSISDRTRRWLVAAVAVLAAVSFGLGAMPAAQAQPAPASDASREAARRKLVEGVEALKRADYQASLARFEEAYALFPSPKIHYDFGLAYVGLGRSAEALAAFERFLAEAPDAPSDKREKAAALVAQLRGRVAETPARDDPEAAGTKSQPVGPQVATAAPRADVPSAPQAVAEYRDDGGTAAAPADHDPLRPRRIAAVSLGAVGTGLVAAGLVFGVLAQGEGDSLTHDSQIATTTNPTPFDRGKESRGVAYERLQVIGLVAGAVLVAAGAALYATSRRRVTVEPVAGPSLAGATLRLTF